MWAVIELISCARTEPAAVIITWRDAHKMAVAAFAAVVEACIGIGDRSRSMHLNTTERVVVTAGGASRSDSTEANTNKLDAGHRAWIAVSLIGGEALATMKTRLLQRLLASKE